MDRKFTADAISNRQTDSEGNTMLISDKGYHVLTMIHPVQINEHPISQKDLERFQADLRLHQYAGSIFDALQALTSGLEALKAGKITVFDFPLDTYIEKSNAVLKRATDIT